MEVLLLFLLIILLVLLLSFFNKFTGTRIFLLLLMILSAAASIFLFSLKGNIYGTQFISSFLSGNTISNTNIFSSTAANKSSYEWKTYNPQLAEIKYGSNAISIKPLNGTRWSMNTSRPMIYMETEGDFFFSARVRAEKNTDAPGVNGLLFAGLIVRDPSTGENENNIFISVGFRYKNYKIEARSTYEGKTSGVSAEWLSGDAELMVQREAAVFGMYVRPYGTEAAWRKVHTLYRPDFPGHLLVGLMAYADSSRSNSLHFDEITFRKNNP